MQQFCLSPFGNLLYTLIQKYLAGREDKQGKNKQCSREKREFFSGDITSTRIKAVVMDLAIAVWNWSKTNFTPYLPFLWT